MGADRRCGRRHQTTKRGKLGRLGLGPGYFDQVARTAYINLLGQVRLLIAKRWNHGSQMHNGFAILNSGTHGPNITEIAPTSFDLSSETLRHLFCARRAQIERTHVMTLSE